MAHPPYFATQPLLFRKFLFLKKVANIDKLYGSSSNLAGNENNNKTIFTFLKEVANIDKLYGNVVKGPKLNQ